MKIIKHGKKPEPLNPVKRFECPRCGCVFEADDSEYYHGTEGWGQANCHGVEVHLYFYCKCPECDAVANEVLMR